MIRYHGIDHTDRGIHIGISWYSYRGPSLVKSFQHTQSKTRFAGGMTVCVEPISRRNVCTTISFTRLMIDAHGGEQVAPSIGIVRYMYEALIHLGGIEGVGGFRKPPGAEGLEPSRTTRQAVG